MTLFIEIDFSEELTSLVEEVKDRIVQAARLIEDANTLYLEAERKNLAARRALNENSKLLRRAFGGPDALHIVEDEEEREKMSSDQPARDRQ